MKFRYKYYPYPVYEEWAFAKPTRRYDFWFSREYTNGEYEYDGNTMYLFKSHFDPKSYARQAVNLIETNFCFDEYIYFRNIVNKVLFDWRVDEIGHYELRAKCKGIPTNKFAILLADMKMMGEAEVIGCHDGQTKPYKYQIIRPVDHEMQFLCEFDYPLNSDLLREFISFDKYENLLRYGL